MDWIEIRQSEYKKLFEKLCDASRVPFDDALVSTLPTTHGVYAISKKNARPGDYLHVGKTNDGIFGLRGRIWNQHCQTGGSSGDLVEKILQLKLGATKREARQWIKLNCVVQWVEVEDDETRGWAEHFMIALMRPRLGC